NRDTSVLIHSVHSFNSFIRFQFCSFFLWFVESQYLFCVRIFRSFERSEEHPSDPNPSTQLIKAGRSMLCVTRAVPSLPPSLPRPVGVSVGGSGDWDPPRL